MQILFFFKKRLQIYSNLCEHKTLQISGMLFPDFIYLTSGSPHIGPLINQSFITLPRGQAFQFQLKKFPSEKMTPNQRVSFRLVDSSSSLAFSRSPLFPPCSPCTAPLANQLVLSIPKNHQNPYPNHSIPEQHSLGKINRELRRKQQNRVPCWFVRSRPAGILGIPSQLRRSEEPRSGSRDGWGRRGGRGGVVHGQLEGDSPGASLQRLHRRQFYHQEEGPPPGRRRLRCPRRSPPQIPLVFTVAFDGSNRLVSDEKMMSVFA